MKTSPEILELEGLFHSLEEGRITEAECETLKELLAGSAEAREEYVRLTEISVSLRNYAAYERPERSNLPRYPKIIAFSVAAAAALILLYLGIQHHRLQPTAPQAQSGFANVIWTDGGTNSELNKGDRIGEFTLDLPAGERIGITMDGGATVSLAGPARVDLLSSNVVYLHEGRAKVRLNGKTRSFSLETEEFQLLDLGTEFGVWANPHGPDETHVIEGAVKVTGTDSIRVLKAGEAVSGTGTPLEYKPGLFRFDQNQDAPLPSSSDILELTTAELKNDKRLVVHFPMDEATAGQLKNQSGSSSGLKTATISGAKWGPGRFEGKPALYFDSPSDAVRMDIPGKFEAITLCAWVRIRSLPNFYNAIFTSDNFHPGNIHWQVERTGGLNLGVSWEEGRWSGLYSKKPVSAKPVGKWLHLATTFNTRTGKCVHYVNGTPLQELFAETELGAKIHIGQASIGNWFDPPSSDERPVRPWNGAIDSFMLFNTDLSPSEIAKLYESTSATPASEK